MNFEIILIFVSFSFSLCSEPVKMYDYNDFQDPLNNNLDDLFDFSGINNNKCTVSLSDLNEATTNETKTGHFTSELNVANDRSDSPILEGIDQELAKYAKLKDLEKAYNPTTTASTASNGLNAVDTCSTSNDAANFHLQRNPDGASNPDLNCKPLPTISASNSMASESVDPSTASNINGNCVPLPLRRSPGNGRSGSEPEDEFERLQQHIKNGADLASDGNSMTSRGSSIPSKSSPSGCSSMSSASSGGGPAASKSTSIMHRPPKATTKRRDERTVLGKSQSTDTSSDIEIWQKPKQQPQKQPPIPEVITPVKKVPKFSRLFKLSRSPLKVIKDESNKMSRRSKSADSRGKEAMTMDPKQPQTTTTKDKKSSQSSKLRLLDNKRISSSTNSLKQPQKTASKNAKGTSSSVGCSTMTTNVTSNSSRSILPSPYSISTAPIMPFKTMATASTASSGSGYDSGHDSVESRRFPSKFIKTCTFVKLRSKGGRGANSSTNNLLTSKRTSERKSSGYESSAGGVDSSERDSIDSLKDGLDEAVNKVVPHPQLPPSAQLTAIKKFYHGLEPLDLLSYDENFIQRLDERWRLHEVRRLQQQQQDLKTDLKEAKIRIGAKSKWTYGLHVADSVQEGLVASTDPSVVEALQKETSILNKRVEAAKSHAVLTTSFDVSDRISKSSTTTCCTTECEPAEDMILLDAKTTSSSTSQETEIF